MRRIFQILYQDFCIQCCMCSAYTFNIMCVCDSMTIRTVMNF
nr:MAG TPA: hypothetical protein [Caudoviricetes sp.]